MLLFLTAIAFGDQVIGKPVLTVVAILLMTMLAQREFLRMARVSLKVPLLLTVGAGAAAFFGRWQSMSQTLGTSTADYLLLLTMGLMFGNLVWATFHLQKSETARVETMQAVAASVFAFVYIALPMGFLQLIAMQNGVAFAALMVLTSKCGDMGGYLAGTKFGRHRVMPHVSPKKSWEGSFGGLVLTLVVLFAAKAWGVDGLTQGSTGQILLFGFLMNVATQMGDFSESMIKRCFAVKDSGDILPTFGGALDILDSLIFAMPVAAFFTCAMG